MNKKLLTAMVGATLAVAGSTANAIDLKISGHLARAVMWADDGITSETYHVDVTSAGSRFRLLASDEVAPGIKAGVNWEMGLNGSPSGTVTQAAKSSGAATVGDRHQEIWFSGAFGRLGVGHSDSAANDIITIDLSGTGIGSGPAPGDIGGGLLFRTSAGGTLSSFGSVLGNLNAGRYDRVRYDSPALGPVVVSASTGHNVLVDTSEFAVRLNTDLGGAGKLAAGVGFVAEQAGGAGTISEAVGKRETATAAASWLSPAGLNVTVAYAQREDEATLDADYARVGVGYIMGQHAASIHYAVGNDQAAVGDEATQLGLTYVYKPQPWIDLFAVAKSMQLDRPGTDAEDILLLLAGSRIVF